MTKHLRGRVRIISHVRRGRAVWEWSVVNTTTGQIVARDDTCLTGGIADAHTRAAELTELCRIALTRGIKLKTLKERP